MEYFAFLGLVLVGAVLFLWRSRRRTSKDLQAQAKGLPDDLRDKNTGMMNRGRPWGG